jgi:hypothetical protein
MAVYVGTGSAASSRGGKLDLGPVLGVNIFVIQFLKMTFLIGFQVKLRCFLLVMNSQSDCQQSLVVEIIWKWCC